MTIRAALILALLAAGIASAAEQPPERTLSIDGRARTYVIHLPNGETPKEPAALVLVLHGGGGNATNAARMSRMDAKSDREGFIAVYPNGTGPLAGRLLTWNAWRCCGSALDNNVDDMAFIRAVVEAMARDYPVDRKRVYATGLSNGGMLAYRVGCELADVFAAIAPVAGALNTDDCKPSAPVSVIVFHGTSDRHVQYFGGDPYAAFDRHKRVDNPVAFAIDFWKRRDKCEDDASQDRKGKIVHDRYSCPDGAAVELYAIEGGGHAWPGGEKGLRAGNVDTPTTEISATDLMWDFFKRHPKK